MATQRLRRFDAAIRCVCYSLAVMCYMLAADVDATYVNVKHEPVAFDPNSVTPDEAWSAVDYDDTVWQLPAGQTTGHFTAEFNDEYAVRQ